MLRTLSLQSKHSKDKGKYYQGIYKNDAFNRSIPITKEKKWLSFEKRRRKREMSDKERLVAYVTKTLHEMQT
jgi:hypothetical protein